jgi:hypothetical protein
MVFDPARLWLAAANRRRPAGRPLHAAAGVRAAGRAGVDSPQRRLYRSTPPCR